uniref:Uncharacterized protein n=1 Tax=Rhizophora mucronata TaxID=61149 RepID=A0A2P2JQJ7_RHIMU
MQKHRIKNKLTHLHQLQIQSDIKDQIANSTQKGTKWWLLQIAKRKQCNDSC